MASDGMTTDEALLMIAEAVQELGEKQNMLTLASQAYADAVRIDMATKMSILVEAILDDRTEEERNKIKDRVGKRFKTLEDIQTIADRCFAELLKQEKAAQQEKEDEDS